MHPLPWALLSGLWDDNGSAGHSTHKSGVGRAVILYTATLRLILPLLFLSGGKGCFRHVRLQGQYLARLGVSRPPITADVERQQPPHNAIGRYRCSGSVVLELMCITALEGWQRWVKMGTGGQLAASLEFNVDGGTSNGSCQSQPASPCLKSDPLQGLSCHQLPQHCGRRSAGVSRVGGARRSYARTRRARSSGPAEEWKTCRLVIYTIVAGYFYPAVLTRPTRSLSMNC